MPILSRTHSSDTRRRWMAMSDSDADSSSLPPPPPPLPHSNSPKAHGSKTKGSPFEGAIQLPIRPSSTTPGRSQVPLNQPSNDSSPVLLARSSQWSPSSEPSTPPISDNFDSIYGSRRRRRCKPWLIGILTSVAVVIAVVFGLYLVGQRQILLKHVHEHHHHHNETSTSINESLVNSSDSDGGENTPTSETPQTTETLNEEEVPGNTLYATTQESIGNEPRGSDSVLTTRDGSTDLNTDGKLDLNTNTVPYQTEISEPKEVPEKPSYADSVATPAREPKPIRKTSKLPPSKLEGDLMEALMEGNHKTVNQLKRSSPNHELTQEEIDTLIAGGEPFPDVNPHSSEEDEEYSEEGRTSGQSGGDFPQQLPGNNEEEERTEGPRYPAGYVESGTLQPPHETVQDVQITGNEEIHQEPNDFQDPNFRGPAHEPIGELSLAYSPEEPVEQEHHFGDVPEQPDGFFPAEHRISSEENFEQPPGVQGFSAESISQEPVEQEHSFGNFRNQEGGMPEQATGYIPSEYRLPLEQIQSQSVERQGFPAGGTQEKSPEMREYPAFGTNMGQQSEEKDFQSGYSSEQAFENEEHPEIITEQQAERHDYSEGTTYRQPSEIEDSIQEPPENLESSHYPVVPVESVHLGGQPYISEVTGEVIPIKTPSSTEESFEEQYLPFAKDKYRTSSLHEENTVPYPGEMFMNEIDSPINMLNRPNLPEQDFAQRPVLIDPFFNQNVPHEPSHIHSNEFDPYSNDVSEPYSTERFDDQMRVEPVDALYDYPQGSDIPPRHDKEQNPDEPGLPAVGTHVSPESAPEVGTPHLFEGPLLADDSEESSGSHVKSGETSIEDFENEEKVDNQEAPGGNLDKLAFSEGPSVFNEGPPLNQYIETRSVPVLGGKLNGEFAGSLDEDDELRTAGQRRSIVNEGPSLPLHSRLLSKFSRREGPPILLPHNELSNQISTSLPSSWLLPEGTIATPAVILEAPPAIHQQSGKLAGLSSPVSSVPSQTAPGSAHNLFSKRFPFPLANPLTKLSGVNYPSQFFQFPYPFSGNPFTLAKKPSNSPGPHVPPTNPVPDSIQYGDLSPENTPPLGPDPVSNMQSVPQIENSPYGVSYLRNSRLLVPSPKHSLNSVQYPLKTSFQGPYAESPLHQNPQAANPLYQFTRYAQPHAQLPHHENIPVECPSEENIPDDLLCDENLPDEPLPPKDPFHQPQHLEKPSEGLLRAEKVPYHLVSVSPSVNPSKLPANIQHLRSHLHPGLYLTPTMRNVPSHVVPIASANGLVSNHNPKHFFLYPHQLNVSSLNNLKQHNYPIKVESPPVRYTPEKIFEPSKIESVHNSLSQHNQYAPQNARNPPWLQPIDYPPSVDSSVLKTLQKLDNLNALNHAQSVTDSETLYPSDESSAKHLPLNAFLHGEKHTPMLTPQTLQPKTLSHVPTTSNYGAYHADEDSIKYPPLYALSHHEKHIPGLSPQNPHQLKSFAPIANERLNPTDKSLVKYPPPQTFLHAGKHTPNLIPQNSRQPKLLAPTPMVTPSEPSHPTDKSSILHPSSNAMLHGDKHTPVFLPQSPHNVNTLSHVTNPETHPTDKGPVKYHPLNAHLHGEKHPSLSPLNAPHTFIEPFPSKSTFSSPVAAEAVSPVETIDHRAHLNNLSQPPVSNLRAKPLAFYEGKQLPLSPSAVYDAKQPSPLPVTVYEAKQPPPVRLPVYDAKQSSPLSVYEPKQRSPSPLALYEANQQHPFSAPSQYTPLTIPDDNIVPTPAPVGHLARPDTAALLKSDSPAQLGLESLTSLYDPEGIANPSSDKDSTEKPSKPSLMLVSSQPIDKITKPVRPNGRPVLPVQFLRGPHSWKDKNIVYSRNFPELPIPVGLLNAPTEQTPSSSPQASPFDASSILSHVAQTVPFTWVQPISRTNDQNQLPGLYA